MFALQLMFAIFCCQVSKRLLIDICYDISDMKIEQGGCPTDSENDDVTSKVDLSSWSEGDGVVQDESEAGWVFVSDESTGKLRWRTEQSRLEERVDGEESGAE